MEPRYNELLYNEVLDITNDFLCSSDSKTYGKETLYKETSLWKTNFASPLALYYIEVPLYTLYLPPQSGHGSLPIPPYTLTGM